MSLSNHSNPGKRSFIITFFYKPTTLKYSRPVYAGTFIVTQKALFFASITLCAYAASIIALNASTLRALTILPRKARREPTYELALEASEFANAYDTPPLAAA